MDPLSLVPDEFKRAILDAMFGSLATLAEKLAADQAASQIRKFTARGAFLDAFDKAAATAVKRFAAEYIFVDEDLVAALKVDPDFWRSGRVREALVQLVSRPGGSLAHEHATVMQHFEDILPRRVNRERVNEAVLYFLRCLAEELWTLPGAKEVNEVYRLQFQRMTAEAASEIVALQRQQLAVVSQFGQDVHQALLQLADALEQKLLAAPQIPPALPRPRPFNNLPQPDYTCFVGREQELKWLRERLSPKDRIWQMAICGIGGVGKSALALAIAHEYRQRYDELPPEERFEAIVWVSAKTEVLTTNGTEPSAPMGLIFRTLDDIYTAISQTLDREDITRAASSEQQDQLVQKALGQQRTLIIVDNVESITDERVRSFLRNLPVPTKAILTSREWVDVVDMRRLTGLSWAEAKQMIAEEAGVRGLSLDTVQQKRLFERTSGLPLPIKLGMARLASGETFDRLTHWLGDFEGSLPEYCVQGQADLAQQRSPHAWQLLFACSLFDREAGASREALGYVTSLSLADRDDGLTVLQRLSLINCTSADRFWLLPIVHGYAAAQLPHTDFAEQLIGRWLEWLLQFARNHGADLDLHVEETPLVEAEYRNLLMAADWCLSQARWQTSAQLIEGAWFYLYLTGLFSELRYYLRAAIDATERIGDEEELGHFFNRWGMLEWVQGRYQDAKRSFVKAEEIARRLNDEKRVARIWHNLSDIIWRSDRDLDKAEEMAKAMLEIGERLNDLRVKVYAVYRLGEFRALRKDFADAECWISQGVAWAEELNWQRALAWMIYRRGVHLLQADKAEVAEQHLARSLEMASLWGERRLIALDKYYLAQAYDSTGRLQLARQTAEEARDLYERLGMATELKDAEELLQRLP